MIVWGVRDGLKSRRVPVFVVLSLILLATMVASVPIAVSKREAMTTCAGFLLRNVAVGWFAYLVAREERSENLVRTWLPVLGAVVAFGAIYEPVTEQAFLFRRVLPEGVDPNELWSPARRIAVGAIGQPLPLATLLNLFLPFALWEWKRRRALAWAIPAAVILLGIMLTFRRSGYTIALVTIAWFALKSGFSGRRFAILGGTVLIFIVGLLAVPVSRRLLLERFNPARTIEEIHGSHRTRVYSTVASIIGRHPILGIGTRQYERRFNEFAEYPNSLPTPDNQYLRYLAEGGILGFGAFSLVILYALSRLLSSGPEGSPYLIAVAGFSMSLFLVDAIYWPATGITFFAVSGLGLGRLDRRNVLTLSEGECS